MKYFFFFTILLVHQAASQSEVRRARYNNTLPAIPLCDQRIVEAIETSWNRNPPTDVIEKLKNDAPWGVVEASPGTFPENTKSVSIYYYKVKIAFSQGNPVETQIPILWEEKNGILTEGTVKWYVVKCDVMTFAFYKCDTQGKEGPPMGGTSIALGPPGGIPGEAHDAALEAKHFLEGLGINLSVHYETFLHP